MSEERRLPYKEWEKLDELLGKHGFGGYYDLVECLKTVLGDLGFSNTGRDIGDPRDDLDLPQVVSYLQDWANILSNDEIFRVVAEKNGTEVQTETELKYYLIGGKVEIRAV